MSIILIAAIGKNNELGKNNNLIWRLKEDLQFFKEHTTGHSIVMGYNTYKSLPKILPNRHHIVLTHRDKKEFEEEVEVFNNKEELLKTIKKINDDIYIIGGASLYKEFIDIADKLLITEIDETCNDADVYFPEINKNNYNITILSEKEENNIKYKHILYEKRDNV